MATKLQLKIYRKEKLHKKKIDIDKTTLRIKLNKIDLELNCNNKC